MNEILKNFGIKFGVKLADGLIKKIPGAVLTKINQRVGFRLITKFGTKGLINLGKMLPAVGALVSGGLDYAETKVIAERAYRWFMKGDFSGDDEDAQDTAEPIIDVEEFEEIGVDAEEEQTTV